MGYYIPDITGTDPAYLVTNETYALFKAGQTIRFDGPVFLESIVVTKQGTLNTVLQLNVDWTVPGSAIDDTAISRVKSSDPAFNKTLVNAITILNEDTGTVSIDYQKLFPVVSKSTLTGSSVIEFTPDLLADILMRLSEVELHTSVISDNSALQSNYTPRLLPIDNNCESNLNVVTDRVTVNVFANSNVVAPTSGSFFRDTVAITIPATNPNTPAVALVKDVDYLVFGHNAAKTRNTTNTSGVYDCILILKQYAGPLDVTTHAYGGEVSLYDVTAISRNVAGITDYLMQSHFLTNENILANSVVQSLHTRIMDLETRMRSLISTGNPNYGDSTNGITVIKKLQSVDTNIHWWSIAHLYQVNGSTEVILADRTHLRFKMQEAGLSADVFVNVDLTTESVFTIDSVAVNQKLGFVPFVSYDPIPVSMPQFRVIYNTDGNNNSGVILQIGLVLNNMIETIAIEDLSGVESCWLLDPVSINAVLPQDDTIPLPNGLAIWNKNSSVSASITKMMPNKTGYLAFAGAMNVGTIVLPNSNIATLGASFNVVDIKSVRIEYMQEVTTPGGVENILRVAVIPVVANSSTKVSGAGDIYSDVDNTLLRLDVAVTSGNGVSYVDIVPAIIDNTNTSVIRHVFVEL